MDDIERAAAETVAGMLGGTWREHDTGAKPLQYDADVLLPDETAIALEVTSTTDSRDVAMWRRISDLEWEFDQLTSSWTLNVTPGTNINQLRSRVAALLEELQRVGLRRFGFDHEEDVDVARDAVEALRRLGVRRAATFSDELKPAVVVLASSRGGATSPELVRKAVEREANKDDNRRKLGQALVDERHLWVWIQAEPATSAMAFDHLPKNPPELPPDVAVVWAGQGYRDDDGNVVVRRLWTVRPPDEWQDLTPALKAQTAAP